MGANRRNFPRHDKRLRARFLDGATWRQCFTANVSVTGIFFESVWIPKTNGVEIEVQVPQLPNLNGPDDMVVRMPGKIIHGARVPPQLVRVAKGGFAVKLLEAPPAWYDYCLALATI